MTLDIDKIYDQLRKMEVSLEEQSHANHHYYQKVLTKCDLYVSVICKYYSAAKQECSKLQVQYNIQAEEIENKRRHHVANNEEIQRRYSTGREREMAIEVILKDEITELKKKDNRLINLKDIVGVLYTWLGIMRERKRDAKEQWKILCEQSKSANLPDPTDKDVRELNKVIGELEAEAAESAMDGDLIVDDDVTSEEYIEGNEESDNEIIEAAEETPSEIAFDDSEEGFVDSEDIEIASGLTGPTEGAKATNGETTTTEEAVEEESDEALQHPEELEESSEEEPDILDMLPSESSSTVEEPSTDIQAEGDSTQSAMKPPEEATQKESEEDNSDEVGLEDDLLEGLDEVDEGLLAGVEDAEQSGSKRASKPKTTKVKDGAVVTGGSPDQTKNVVAETGEPTSKTEEVSGIDASEVSVKSPQETKPEGQGKKFPKESKEKEDAASVSTDVDIEDILGELDGF